MKKKCKTNLIYTPESLRDGHGFVQIKTGETLFCSRCWVSLASGRLDAPTLGKIGLLHDLGGRRDLRFCEPAEPLDSEYLAQLGDRVFLDNPDVFQLLSCQVSTPAIFPSRVVEAFREIALAHLETLSGEYWRSMRSYTGKAYAADPHAGQLLTRAEVCQRYLMESARPISQFLSAAPDAVVVGEIEGEPVWFRYRSGQYAFAGDSNALDMLEIWSTGSTYPPHFV